MARILVVDDEQDICEIVQFNLQKDGYRVDVAHSGEEALPMILGADADPYALVLLDVMMGEMSGFDVAQRLRALPATASIPIIFMTALGSEDDVVRGLNLGADDYMPKPISMRELRARVQAVLRRSKEDPIRLPQGEGRIPQTQEETGDALSYGTLRLSDQTRTAKLDGQAITLTKMEFELLRFLLLHKNTVYSRDALLLSVWPDDGYVLERTVDVTVNRLRKKLGQYKDNLKTKTGYGYYFEA